MSDDNDKEPKDVSRRGFVKGAAIGGAGLLIANDFLYPERAAAAKFLKERGKPKECLEDLQWALVNSKEFLFVH